MSDFITIAEYAERFGAREMTLATNDRTENTVAPADLQAYIDGEDTSPSSDVLLIETIFEARRADAQSYMESFLSAVVALPFDTAADVPLIVRQKCADIIRHEMHAKTPPAVVRQRYEDAKEWLTALARQKRGLSLDAGGDAPVKKDRSKVAARADITDGVFTTAQTSRFVDGYDDTL